MYIPVGLNRSLTSPGLTLVMDHHQLLTLSFPLSFPAECPLQVPMHYPFLWGAED